MNSVYSSPPWTKRKIYKTQREKTPIFFPQEFNQEKTRLRIRRYPHTENTMSIKQWTIHFVFREERAANGSHNTVHTHTQRESVLCQDEKKHIIRLVGTFERACATPVLAVSPPYYYYIYYILFTTHSFLRIFFTVAWALGASTHAVLWIFNLTKDFGGKKKKKGKKITLSWLVLHFRLTAWLYRPI